MKNKTYNKRKILIVFIGASLMILGLIARLCYLMIFDAEYYQKKAEALHEREREIKAARGEIIDRNGKVLATNKTVCTVSVIHSQIEDADAVTKALAGTLEMEEEIVRKKVEKVSSMERIKTNVEKEVGDRIREMNLAGVKVDEDFKRYYPRRKGYQKTGNPGRDRKNSEERGERSGTGCLRMLCDARFYRSACTFP